MKAFLSPIKGKSTDSDDYPHRIDIERLTSGDFMDFELQPALLEALHESKGDVGTFFMVVAGTVIYQLAFSDAKDAMLFKLRFYS